MLSTGCWTAALSHQFLCQSKLEVQNLSDNIDWAYLRVVSIKDNISEQNIFKLYFKFQTARKNYRKIVIFHLINNTLQKKSTFENFAHQFQFPVHTVRAGVRFNKFQTLVLVLVTFPMKHQNRKFLLKSLVNLSPWMLQLILDFEVPSSFEMVH